METLCVLVVDDEPGIRSGVSRVLANLRVSFPFMDDDMQFRVVEAASAEEALSLMRTDHPEIVLLDNKLPGMSGLEFLSAIRKEEFEPLVVMITSYASVEVAVKATRDGAHDFIPKPFTPQELRSSMENLAKQVYLRKMTRKMNTEGKQVRFQFLSVLSHEMKTPLNAVEGYLKLMKEHQAGPLMDSYHDMIDRSLERITGMRGMIQDMLDLTRLESSSKERRLVPVNLVKVAYMSVDTFKPLSIQKDVRITLSGEDEIWLDAVEDEMEIILNNLISNAVKYNRPGGEVLVQFEKKDESVFLKVKDTGIGMTAEERAKLFEEFVRIRNQKTRNITGSGLGLSIVKRLLSRYQGEITVDSTPDKGSTFTVKFRNPK